MHIEKERKPTTQAKEEILLRAAEHNKTEAGFVLRRMLRKEVAAYAWVVDTFSAVTFYTPICMVDEILFAGMSLKQSLKIRAMGAVTSSLFGGPYGKFRDYVFRKAKITDSSSFLRKAFVDTAAAITFWMPVYVGQMCLAGASRKSIIIASAIALPFSLVEGRPFGMYMDWMRKRVGLRPAAKTIDIAHKTTTEELI